MTVMKKLINLWPSIKHKNKINIKIILHYHHYSSGGNKSTNVRSFSISQSREVLTFFNNDNCANFFGEKKVQSTISGCLFFEITRKKFKSNIVVVVVLVLESKGLNETHLVQAGWWVDLSLTLTVI